MNEVIVITGSRGVGKSTLAATYLPPRDVSSVFVHDSENSMNNIRAQLRTAGLDFGHYVNLESRFANADLPSEDDLLSLMNRGKFPWVTADQKASLMNYYEYVLNDLASNLTKGKFKVYIHDTLDKLEAGMVAWTEEHKKELGLMPNPFAWGKFWTAGVYALYQNLLEALFARGVETVILCSHLKDATTDKGKVIVGKVVPRGKPLLYRISSLMLWLMRDKRNADGTPAALVLKERLGKLSVVDGDWEIKRMLPERLPRCTWRDVNNYLSGEVPISLDNPRDGESMTQAEQDMISELVSKEQMRLMILAEEKDVLEMRAQIPELLQTTEKLEIPGITGEASAESNETAMTLLAEGKSPMAVAKELGLPLPLVLEAKKKMEESQK